MRPDHGSRRIDLRIWLVALIPVAAMLWVWFSTLSFVPVPWPDDSAFYFVGRDLFHWPPRWVMIPQAPFEPTYRIFNFNTMPLYPILVGLGRLVGIDGSWGLKFWPLSAWAATGVLVAAALTRPQKNGARMPLLLAMALVAPLALDPELRWASVLVRPESLIGLFGTALVLGLTLGFPRRLRARGLWDPVAALLALGAYAHFNAIHLLFPVVAVSLRRPRRLYNIGWRTLLYMWPWLIMVSSHPVIFLHQMKTQWKRLQVPNSWLQSVDSALKTVFDQMGAPAPLPPMIRYVAMGIWALIFVALIAGVLLPVFAWAMRRWDQSKRHLVIQETSPISLLPAGAWVLGSIWLWHTKPEVWFLYFVHLSLFVFLALAGLKAWRSYQSRGFVFLPLVATTAVVFAAAFFYADLNQEQALASDPSWRWSTHRSFIDCIDAELSRAEKEMGYPKPFRVWDPTYPDVIVELSRRHPDWELTRTNDFWDRYFFALQHGRDVEAVVVPETINTVSRWVQGPMSEHRDILSVWMEWKDYFLNKLMTEPGWKSVNRYVCQRGRWTAFIFEK